MGSTKKAVVSSVPKSLLSLVRKAVSVKASLVKLQESKVAVLEERLAGITAKLMRDMKAAGVTNVTLENNLGYATMFQQKAPSRLDEKAVAAKLGVADLSEFKVSGKESTRIKVGFKGEKAKKVAE